MLYCIGVLVSCVLCGMWVFEGVCWGMLVVVVFCCVVVFVLVGIGGVNFCCVRVFVFVLLVGGFV